MGGCHRPDVSLRRVARLIVRVLENISDENVLAEVRRSVAVLTDRFPLYAWKLAAAVSR